MFYFDILFLLMVQFLPSQTAKEKIPKKTDYKCFESYL